MKKLAQLTWKTYEQEKPPWKPGPFQECECPSSLGRLGRHFTCLVLNLRETDGTCGELLFFFLFFWGKHVSSCFTNQKKYSGESWMLSDHVSIVSWCFMEMAWPNSNRWWSGFLTQNILQKTVDLMVITILFLYIKTCRPWSLVRGFSSKIPGAPVIILSGGQSLCCNQDKPQCAKTTKKSISLLDKLSVIYQTDFRDSKNPLLKAPVSVASQPGTRRPITPVTLGGFRMWQMQVSSKKGYY